SADRHDRSSIEQCSRAERGFPERAPIPDRMLATFGIVRKAAFDGRGAKDMGLAAVACADRAHRCGHGLAGTVRSADAACKSRVNRAIRPQWPAMGRTT